MSSKLSLQKPYVVATLPTPIDPSKGKYVVGDVYGGVVGSRKRKRPELVVGIDGEAVNLYEISASRLISSYALPPQTSFTCAPSSLRTKISKSKTERRTYVSTAGPSPQITLFYESTDRQTPAKSFTKSRTLEKSKHQIVFVGTVVAPRASDASSKDSDLLIVKEDGEIRCVDGDSLEDKWLSPPSALGRDVSSSNADQTVEFVQLSNAFAASQGILQGRQDVLSMFPQEISKDTFNPDVLLLITSLKTAGVLVSRTIHIVTPPRISSITNKTQAVECLLSTVLPSRFDGKPSFGLQDSAGILQMLAGQELSTFDFTSTVPTAVSNLKVSNAQSFMRLSNSAIMVSTGTEITIYNPKYRSKLTSVSLASAEVDGSFETGSREQRKRKRVGGKGKSMQCKLVSYLPKLDTVIAICENQLVALHIEGKTRDAGSLIDSLGNSIPNQRRPGHEMTSVVSVGLKTMHKYLPGSIGLPGASIEDQMAVTTHAFKKGNTELFDKLMAKRLGEDWERYNIGESKSHVNGSEKMENGTDSDTVVNGVLPPVVGQDQTMKDSSDDVKKEPRPDNIAAETKRVEPRDSSKVDKRWIIYALKKIFTWTEMENGEHGLNISFYPPNVFMWLLTTGYMTITNIESALRDQIHSSSLDSLPNGQLANSLVELDPDMDLLYGLLSKTFLPAGELVAAIRIIMESLGSFGDSTAANDNTTGNQLPIMNRENVSVTSVDEVMEDNDVEELEAQLESDLALAESRLSENSDRRAEALDLALAKLHACPSEAIVYALQTQCSVHEILSLIYELRFQMRNGSWTSRYVESSFLDDDESEGGRQDNSLLLICSLLHNCVDSIGAGGWISGDDRLFNGNHFEAEEFIESLVFEISATLEGIQEAEYLRGLLQPMIQYGHKLWGPEESRSSSDVLDNKKPKTTSKPILLPFPDDTSQMLPLGLRVDADIPLVKIVPGSGEVLERSKREILHLKSRKVGKYSLERIII